jgi:hypothetical protein
MVSCVDSKMIRKHGHSRDLRSSSFLYFKHVYLKDKCHMEEILVNLTFSRTVILDPMSMKVQEKQCIEAQTMWSTTLCCLTSVASAEKKMLKV